MSEIMCPVCNKNPAMWNDKDKWWELCDECKSNDNQSFVNNIKTKCGIPPAYLKYTLDFYKDKSVSNMRSLSNNFRKNIILYGISYTGKTALMCSIVDDIIKRTLKKHIHLDIRFVNVFELLTNITFNKTIFWTELEKYKKCDILLLDEMVSDYNEEEYRFLYLLLNYRASENKITFSTTNVEINDSRLFSRLKRVDGIELEVTKDSWC